MTKQSKPTEYLGVARVARLSSAEQDILCFGINALGAGQHPVATPHGLHNFGFEYACETLYQLQAMEKQLTDGARALAASALAALRAPDCTYTDQDGRRCARMAGHLGIHEEVR